MAIKDEMNDIFRGTPEHDDKVFRILKEMNNGNAVVKIINKCGIHIKSLDNKPKPGSIKELMDRIFNADKYKINKLINIGISYEGILPMPEKGESVNIRILTAPKNINNVGVSRCAIYGHTDFQFDIWLSKTIYKGILAELKRAEIPVDNNMRCIVGHVFTVAGREWHTAPIDMWSFDSNTNKNVPPKTYAVALRPDLEKKLCIPEGTASDILEQPSSLPINNKWILDAEYICKDDKCAPRGRIDIMTYNEYMGIVLFIDFKTNIPSIQEVLGKMKEYKALRDSRIEKIDARWSGYVHKEITDYMDAYYIVISQNVTEMQKEYFEMGGIYLIDIKDIMDIDSDQLKLRDSDLL